MAWVAMNEHASNIRKLQMFRTLYACLAAGEGWGWAGRDTLARPCRSRASSGGGDEGRIWITPYSGPGTWAHSPVDWSVMIWDLITRIMEREVGVSTVPNKSAVRSHRP